MNVERILELADFLEKVETEEFKGNRQYNTFNMNTYGSDHGADCKTPACIAGWAVRLFEPQPIVHDVQGHGRDLLGLSTYQAIDLFLPSHCHEAYDANNLQAAKVLRDLAETGVVDWEEAIKCDEQS